MTGMETACWMPLIIFGSLIRDDAARRADVRRDAFERHNGAGARRLRDFRLLGRGDVHDHAALEHLGQIFVQFVTVLRHFS